MAGCEEPSRLPSTRASRADHRPTRQRPYVRQGRLTWRAGRRPAPQKGGSTADGMATENAGLFSNLVVGKPHAWFRPAAISRVLPNKTQAFARLLGVGGNLERAPGPCILNVTLGGENVVPIPKLFRVTNRASPALSCFTFADHVSVIGVLVGLPFDHPIRAVSVERYEVGGSSSRQWSG